MTELLAPFATLQGWLTIVILFFLEVVLGIDNLVFIAITSSRLPAAKQSLGRRLGLALALVMRIILLSLCFLLVHLTATLFTLPFTIPGTDPAFNAKDLILLAGGLYLVIKGLRELVAKISLKEEKEAAAQNLQNGEKSIPAHTPSVPLRSASAQRERRTRSSAQITLSRAVLTIVAMDAIFSLDSVITAVGLSGQLLVMILAVILAVVLMIIFADPISNFINQNPEMKILALVFICLVGLKLIAESFGIELLVQATHISVLDLMLYFAMFLTLLVTILQMAYIRRRKKLDDDLRKRN